MPSGPAPCAACGTLGLNITATRVLLFSVSAAMAGVAGALFSGMFVSVGAPDFAMFRSLPLLLLLVVGGVTSVTGALIGGLALGFTPVVQDAYPALGGIVYLLIGGAAIALGRDPNGLAGMMFRAARKVRRKPAAAPDSGGPVAQDTAAEEVGLVATP